MEYRAATIITLEFIIFIVSLPVASETQSLSVSSAAIRPQQLNSTAVATNVEQDCIGDDLLQNRKRSIGFVMIIIDDSKINAQLSPRSLKF